MGMNTYNRVESLRRSIAMERPGRHVAVKLNLTREEALELLEHYSPKGV